jgi:hypothetical protein
MSDIFTTISYSGKGDRLLAEAAVLKERLDKIESNTCDTENKDVLIDEALNVFNKRTHGGRTGLEGPLKKYLTRHVQVTEEPVKNKHNFGEHVEITVDKPPFDIPTEDWYSYPVFNLPSIAIDATASTSRSQRWSSWPGERLLKNRDEPIETTNNIIVTNNTSIDQMLSGPSRVAEVKFDKKTHASVAKKTHASVAKKAPQRIPRMQGALTWLINNSDQDEMLMPVKPENNPQYKRSRRNKSLQYVH